MLSTTRQTDSRLSEVLAFTARYEVLYSPRAVILLLGLSYSIQFNFIYIAPKQ